MICLIKQLRRKPGCDVFNVHAAYGLVRHQECLCVTDSRLGPAH